MPQTPPVAARTRLGSFFNLSLLTLFALCVLGYHPYAEDGGLYLAGVEKLLNPRLFPAYPGFVTAHLRFSLFAPAVAALVRLSHLPLDWLVAALYVLSTAAELAAGWLLASRLFATAAARNGAVLLLACWLGLPIAGTSVMLLDPYLTARSLTTPLLLAALAWSFDALADADGVGRRAWLKCCTALFLAALLHPLMALYGAATVVCVASAHTVDSGRRTRRMVALLLAAFTLATALQLGAPPASAAYRAAVETRYYWFPQRWHWYELLGLLAPLPLLASASLRRPPAQRALLQGIVLLAIITALLAFTFGVRGLAAYPVARLQPLRSLQTVYQVLLLLLGGWLGQPWSARVLRPRSAGATLRYSAAALLLAWPMVLYQRAAYAHSPHLELPGRAPQNGWVQAFLWARHNTPVDALFALDAHYITTAPGEDAQCFRALAQRSALPDYSKDGGEASISPWLTGDWQRGVAAQQDFSSASDTQRERGVRPLGADWAVLPASATTAWRCPYTNSVAKICRLP